MTTDNGPQGGQQQAEDGATEVARVLHGDQARAEQYEQPEAVTLPGDTRVAAPASDDTDERPATR